MPRSNTTFKPGNFGKPKGSTNRTTREAKEIFNAIMMGEIDYVKDTLEKIRQKSPYNYIVCLSKLMPYFMPKQLDIKSDGEKLQAPVIQILPPDEG